MIKEVILKHYDERYTMMRILLDDGLRELKEVADLQTKEEQHKRLVALQNKQRWLSLIPLVPNINYLLYNFP